MKPIQTDEASAVITEAANRFHSECEAEGFTYLGEHPPWVVSEDHGRKEGEKLFALLPRTNPLAMHVCTACDGRKFALYIVLKPLPGFESSPVLPKLAGEVCSGCGACDVGPAAQMQQRDAFSIRAVKELVRLFIIGTKDRIAASRKDAPA